MFPLKNLAHKGLIFVSVMKPIKKNPGSRWWFLFVILNKLSSCQWFEARGCLYDVTVMTGISVAALLMGAVPGIYDTITAPTGKTLHSNKSGPTSQLTKTFKLTLTHLPLDKMTAFSVTAFQWMKSFVFWLKFHWSLFLMIQLAISQHWFW